MDTQTERRLPHAYLVESSDEGERRAMALDIAAEALCESPGARPCRVCRHCRKVYAGIHPDVTVVAREETKPGEKRREITVGQIRALTAASAVLPNEASRRVFLIDGAESMNRAAQNALLKLLEEPPAWLCLILCPENALELLDTVRSRCVLRRKNAAPPPQPPETETFARELLRAFAARDDLVLLRACALREGLDTQSLTALLVAAQTLTAEALCGRGEDFGLGRGELLRLNGEFSRGEAYLRSNVGVKHVLGMLSAFRQLTVNN